MAYFMLAMLRMGGVLASRTELQDKGVLDPDCPVCLGQLGGGNGFVTFHLLECGHRCEAARTCAVRAPHVRAFDTDAKVELLTLARVPVRVCRRVHEDCLLQIEETPDAAGGVLERTCPLCRGASRSTCAFVVHGALT